MVELLVANEKVVGSNPIVRSNGPVVYWLGHVTFTDEKADRNRSGLPSFRNVGRTVMQRTANAYNL